MATKKTSVKRSQTRKVAVDNEKTPEPPKSVYHLTISVNDSVVENDTDNILETLRAYEFPPSIKTDVIFRVTKDGRSTERVFGVFKGRRVFKNPTALQLLASSLIKTLG